MFHNFFHPRICSTKKKSVSFHRSTSPKYSDIGFECQDIPYHPTTAASCNPAPPHPTLQRGFAPAGVGWGTKISVFQVFHPHQDRQSPPPNPCMKYTLVPAAGRWEGAPGRYFSQLETLKFPSLGAIHGWGGWDSGQGIQVPGFRAKFGQTALHLLCLVGTFFGLADS